VWTAKLGMWERHREGRCLVLEVDDASLRLLPDRIKAVVAPGGSRVSFVADPEGMRFTPQTRSSMPYLAAFCAPSGALSGHALPAFELMDVELSVSGETWWAALPPVHDLPWPSRKSFRAAPDQAAMAAEALEARVASAVASGHSNLSTNPIPGHVREHLAPGAFMEAMRTARTLSGALA